MSAVEENTAPRLVLIQEALAGGDLAYMVREVFRKGGRGLDPQAWEGATLPSGQPVTLELVRALERILVRAKLARRKPIKGARAELLADHRQALEALATML